MKKDINYKKILRFGLKKSARIIFAAVMVFISLGIILWDQGKFPLPFIGYGNGIPVYTQKRPETQDTEYIFDYEKYSEDVLNSFYKIEDIENAETRLCSDQYSENDMTIAVKKLGNGDFFVENGYIKVIKDEKIFYTDPFSEKNLQDGMIPTKYFNETGKRIFQSGDSFFIMDSNSMIQTEFTLPEKEPDKDLQNLSFIPKGFTATDYSEGIYIIKNDSGFAYFTEGGIFITDPEYKGANKFSEGLAKVENSDGKFGMIDKSGKETVGIAFDSVTDVSGGIFVAKLGDVSYLFCKLSGKEKSKTEPIPTSSKVYYTKAPLVTDETVSTTKTQVIVITEEPKPRRTTVPERTLKNKTPPVTTTVPTTTSETEKTEN